MITITVLWIWTHRIRIRFRIRTRIRIQGFDDKKLKKNTAEKCKLFLSKITIYSSQGLHKRRPSYRRSLQSSKENIEHFKKRNLLFFSYFYRSFLPSWIRIRIANPDPAPVTPLNSDPDPKHRILRQMMGSYCRNS